MNITILDPTTRTAVGAATDQEAQLDADLNAPFTVAGSVVLNYYSAADVLLATVTHPSFILVTSVEPRELRVTGRGTESYRATGPTAASYVVAKASGVEIFRGPCSLAQPIGDNTGQVSLLPQTGATGLVVAATASLPLSGLPSWVPSTAWEWTSLGSTTVWANYIKDDGSGVAASLASTPRPPLDVTYTTMWNYCGTAYSQARHEIYHFGGGHAQSFINILTRWNLSTDTPSIDVAMPQTSASARKTRFDAFAGPNADSRTYFADEGNGVKPYSSHTYRNLMYSDALDKLLIFGFGYMASPGLGGDGGGDGWTSPDVAAWTRGGSWAAQGAYSNIPVDQPFGPRFIASDGVVYYWQNNPPTQLRKYTPGNDTHANVGASSLTSYYSRQADDGNGRALSLGSDGTGGAWLAQYVDLSSGSVTAVTVSGDSIPSGRGIYGLVWCQTHGYWLAVFFNSGGLYANSGANAISAVTVATITPTGSSTATASGRTMTGTGPVEASAYHGLHFDPTFDTALLVTHYAQPVLAFKVGA